LKKVGHSVLGLKAMAASSPSSADSANDKKIKKPTRNYAHERRFDQVRSIHPSLKVRAGLFSCPQALPDFRHRQQTPFVLFPLPNENRSFPFPSPKEFSGFQQSTALLKLKKLLAYTVSCPASGPKTTCTWLSPPSCELSAGSSFIPVQARGKGKGFSWGPLPAAPDEKHADKKSWLRSFAALTFQLWW
jgi:hypothetical protein